MDEYQICTPPKLSQYHASSLWRISNSFSLYMRELGDERVSLYMPTINYFRKYKE